MEFHTKISDKLLHIRFDKMDGLIRISDGTIYLVLFGSKKYDYMYNRNRYLISAKSGITYVVLKCYNSY